jgi:hypothetical protein
MIVKAMAPYILDSSTTIPIIIIIYYVNARWDMTPRFWKQFNKTNNILEKPNFVLNNRTHKNMEFFTLILFFISLTRKLLTEVFFIFFSNKSLLCSCTSQPNFHTARASSSFIHKCRVIPTDRGMWHTVVLCKGNFYRCYVPMV